MFLFSFYYFAQNERKLHKRKDTCYVFIYLSRILQLLEWLARANFWNVVVFTHVCEILVELGNPVTM